MDSAAIAAISGAAGVLGTAFFNWMLARRKLEDSSRKTLHEVIDDKRKEIERLSRIVSQQRTELTLLQMGSLYELPIPYWIVDRFGKMLHLSDVYETTFCEPLGKTRHDYIGKTHVEFWGTEIGEEFEKNDAALNTPNQYFIGTEHYSDRGLFLFLKTPMFLNKAGGLVKLGVFAMAIPIDPRVRKDIIDETGE